MRRLAHPVCATALLAVALLASAEPLRAQEEQPPPDASTVAPSSPDPARPSERRDRGAARRPFVRREPLPGADTLTRAEQRAVRRHLFRMDPQDRERFLRDWDRMSPLQRRAFVREHREHRSPRELPARLRTPEMRQRLEEMTPEERQRFFRQAREWREMKPAQRGRIRARLHRFGALDEAAQRKLIDQKFRDKTPEQREKILRDLQKASRLLREREARSRPETQTSPERAP